jgi:hypothetical protein
MNPFIQQLLRQAGSRIIPRAVRSVQGFADDLAAPVLRGVGTLTENALVRSVGAVKDAVVRPGTRFSQKINSPRTFDPGLSGQVQVKQQTGRFAPYIPLPDSFNSPRYLDGAQRFLKEFGSNVTSGTQRTAASLRPGPASVQFPLNDPLTLLQGNARHLQRQAQAGIDTSQGVFRNLQSLGPTALNPFATSTPTTALGKFGKFVNPLNPLNAGGYLAGGLLSALPDSNPIKGNLEIATYVPGGILPKIAATTIFGATPAGSADESRLIRESNALRQSGQNYIVNGIEYDYKTGRALNPPTNVFVPVRQDNGIDRSYQRDPAERSYQGELQRTAQLTAQNPELKRYEADRVKAKTQEERNAVRDMGLAIWQKEYGQKQIGKPGGAIGTFNPLMSTGNTTQTTGNQLVVPINTDEVPYQVGDFSRATLDSGYDSNAFGITPGMIEELQKRLLLQGIK